MPVRASARVYLHDRAVGTLSYRDQWTTFTYEDFAADRPVFGQAFEDDPDRLRSAKIELPAWFENLLQEEGTYLRHVIAERAGVNPRRSFPILLSIGEDLPGAVRVVADDGNATNWDEDVDTEVRDEIEGPLNFGLAGIQPKFSMVRTGRGLTLPARGGGGNLIVKTPDRRPGHDKVPENEWTMLRWVARAGLDVAIHKLVDQDDLAVLPAHIIRPGERALEVSRFDRTPGGRVHMEDLAQVREAYPKEKYDRTSYDAIAKVLATLCPAEDVDEYVRRLVAIVAMGNGDAHLKNWTLLYREPRQPHLSPAYDLLCVTCYGPYATDRLAFSLGRERIFERVNRDSFKRLASRADLNADHVTTIVDETVDRLQTAWRDVRHEPEVPDFLVAHIDERLKTLPLLRSG